MEQLSATRARLGLDAYRVQSRRVAAESPGVSTLPEPAPRTAFAFSLGKLQVSILEHAPQAQAEFQAKVRTMADSLATRRHEDWMAARQAEAPRSSTSSTSSTSGASPTSGGSGEGAASTPEVSPRLRAAALRGYADIHAMLSREDGVALGVV